MIKLVVSEEYGYRYWAAMLTNAEYAVFVSSWCRMRGLNCLVPIRLLLPNAVLLRNAKENPNCVYVEKHAHIHESDDSGIDNVDYIIPEDDVFTWEGRTYTDVELCALPEYTHGEIGDGLPDE